MAGNPAGLTAGCRVVCEVAGEVGGKLDLDAGVDVVPTATPGGWG
jgi:hypothetical protein